MSLNIRDEPVFYVRVKPPPVAYVGGGGSVLNPLINAKAQLAKAEAILTRAKAGGAPGTVLADMGSTVEKFKARVAELSNVDAAIKAAQANVSLGIGVYTADAMKEAQARLAALKADKSHIAQSAAPPPPPPPPPPPARDVSQAVLSFTFEEGEKKIDALKLTIENNDLRWFDDPIFEKGTTLIVSWGYAGRMSPPREVIVQKVTGSLTLTIEAHGKDVLMNKVARTRTFTNMTRAEVVRQIAEENGYGDEATDIDTGAALQEASTGDASSSAAAALANAQAQLKKARGIYARVAAAPEESTAPDFVLSTRATVDRLEALVKERQVAAIAASAAKAKASAIPVAPQDPVPRYPSITQAGQTDAQFIKKLADLQGFEFYVDFDGLHWHPRRMGQHPVLTWTYYLPSVGQIGDIITFNVDNDVTAKPGEVKIAQRDPLTKVDTVVTANNATVPRATTAPAPELFAAIDPKSGVQSAAIAKPVGTTATEVRPTTEPTAAGAKAEAAGIFTRTQQATVQLVLEVVGNPDLVAKTIVLINGLGKRMSGRYYITEIAHKVVPGQGYVMTVKCRSDGTNKAASNAAVAADKSAATPNTKPGADANDTGKLSPKQIIDPVNGTSKTIYVDTRGRDAAKAS